MVIQHRSKSVSRRRLATWLKLLLIGVMLYLVTRNPIIGACLPCLYASSGLLSSGWWLLHTDPNWPRGTTCFLFYLAAACWNAAAAAFISFLTFLAVEAITGNMPNMDALGTTLITLLSGAVLTSLIGAVAVILAVARGVRVWVGTDIRSVWRGDYPPAALHDRRGTGYNHAAFVVITALVFPFLAVGCVLLAVFDPNVNPNQAGIVSEVLGLTMLFAGPMAMIPVYAFLSHRIIAQSPAACWPIELLLSAQMGTRIDQVQDGGMQQS